MLRRKVNSPFAHCQSQPIGPGTKLKLIRARVYPDRLRLAEIVFKAGRKWAAGSCHGLGMAAGAGPSSTSLDVLRTRWYPIAASEFSGSVGPAYITAISARAALASTP